MLINKSEYLISAVNPNNYPNKEMPQFLLMGRSNVGKSSFINAVCNRKQLAFTSSKPGKTATLNFYLLNDSMMFVDAPGYGYAKTAKETRVDFGELIEKYLNEDLNLKGVFLIIDSRHLPTNDDLMVYDFLLQFDVPIYIIATKTDKLGTTIVQKNINQIKKSFNNQVNIIPFSSETKKGIDKIEEILRNTNN